MASIHAPSYHIDSNNRSGIDLLCVIDKSGSMNSSNRMTLVKYTVNIIINKFLKNKNDRIGIITFSNTSQTLLPLTILNNSRQSKQKALTAVASLYCSGSTALCDGLVEGIKLMKTNNSSNNLVRSIFLFTDGEANVGKTTTEEIIYEVIKNKDGMNCTINTFGCGQQHNASLLQSIAEQGNNGMYAYIDSEKIIAKTLAQCVGGLMGIIAQNININIECISSDVQIMNTLSKGYKYSYQIDDKCEMKSDEGANTQMTYEGKGKRKVMLEINDIQSEENRDLLFELKIPKIGKKVNKYDLVKVCVNYTNVIKDMKESVVKVCSIARDVDEGKEEKESNIEIDIQCNRLLAADSMLKSDAAAEKGDLKKAKEILKNAQNVIRNSVSAKDKFCVNLVKDMGICLENMKDVRSYRSGGGKMLKMNATCHEQQRASQSAAWGGQERYCTTTQYACIDEVD
eukprot:282492_1